MLYPLSGRSVLKPRKRLQRIADRFMLGVEYTHEDRGEGPVIVAAARGDGEVTDKDQSLLDRLAMDLGIHST